ncbi:MAG: hypothetical protein ISS93_00400 [Candidatus Aenigmarchaeota archaeon]|nr:hypothetical protein [Candidatus Aenigmarchaeota archaeon]
MGEEKIAGKWWDISVAEGMKEFQAERGEWVLDPNGYFLIRVNHQDGTIEVGFCTNDHKLRAKITGKHPIEIYFTLIKEGMISRLDHAADMGVELEKAYLALKRGLEYVQDSELELKD